MVVYVFNYLKQYTPTTLEYVTLDMKKFLVFSQQKEPNLRLTPSDKSKLVFFPTRNIQNKNFLKKVKNIMRKSL